MQRHSLFSTCFCLLVFLCGGISGQAQTYTYPFDKGHAELPVLMPTKNKPVRATYSLRNPTNKPVDVVLFLELDDTQLYRIDGGKRTLLGQAGCIYPAYLLQFSKYPEFGLHHRNGILFQLPSKQTTQLEAVFQNKTTAGIIPAHPLLFSRATYQQFLEHRISEHMQTQLLAMIFVGCLLIMFLYTSMQYVILRERILLYYAIYVLLVSCEVW